MSAEDRRGGEEREGGRDRIGRDDRQVVVVAIMHIVRSRGARLLGRGVFFRPSDYKEAAPQAEKNSFHFVVIALTISPASTAHSLAVSSPSNGFLSG